jgi:ABC-type antimicrobial peptide transport system permease subunit
MRFIDVIRLATRNFRSNRLRTFLTVLAVSVATAAILFLVSFGYGIQLLTVQQIANSATISTVDVKPVSQKSLLQIDSLAIEKIKALPDVVAIAPELDIEGQVKADSIGTVVVHAIDPNYFAMADIRTTQGSVFNVGETHKAVVSNGFLAQFSFSNDSTAIGKKFDLTYMLKEQDQNSADATPVVDSTQFEIVGIAEDGQNAVYIYVPLADTTVLVKNLPYANLKVQSAGREKVISVKDNIASLGYDSSAPLETLNQLDQVFAVVQIVLGTLGLIALIISSIGMFNTMTIALLERTKEIGIMKALGADKGDVWKLFITEATIIGFAGGLSGVVLGMSLTTIANIILNILARIYGGQQANIFYSPLWFIAAIIIFSTIVGSITGFYPARRAASLNPLKALRYE